MVLLDSEPSEAEVLLRGPPKDPREFLAEFPLPRPARKRFPVPGLLLDPRLANPLTGFLFEPLALEPLAKPTRPDGGSSCSPRSRPLLLADTLRPRPPLPFDEPNPETGLLSPEPAEAEVCPPGPSNIA